MATLVSINISDKKGMRKTPIPAVLITFTGLAGDAHSGDWHRMVSLLAEESIDKMRAMGLDVKAGDFAENLTTRGLDLLALPLGSKIKVGPVLMEITQHGKECHTRCAIYHQAGDCVMPKEGIFAKVLSEGEVKNGDEIVIVKGE
ncbi:MOSC domain-containing protein [bacterium]|nr:MAG: MOSC domain-containing protein [bacterium]